MSSYAIMQFFLLKMWLAVYDTKTTDEINTRKESYKNHNFQIITSWLRCNQLYDSLWKINFLTLYKGGLKGFRPDKEENETER